ncbi:hypothetical protein HY479_00240 [Candidatus Uhrbacteria bacterium]|nr:hypothetical protein [Candidatus Uhrbacteria bacterium]
MPTGERREPKEVDVDIRQGRSWTDACCIGCLLFVLILSLLAWAAWRWTGDERADRWIDDLRIQWERLIRR